MGTIPGDESSGSVHVASLYVREYHQNPGMLQQQRTQGQSTLTKLVVCYWTHAISVFVNNTRLAEAEQKMSPRSLNCVKSYSLCWVMKTTSIYES